MKIGIIGSGMVGQTLGEGFAAGGHGVKIGTRDASKLAAWAGKLGVRGSVGSNAEAATFGDIVIVATAWSGTENALRLAEPKNVAGKVVIDVTNPLAFADGKLSLVVGHTDSAGETVQRWLPEANVVKAFNIVNAGVMVNPHLSGGDPDMFIAGNDADAKQVVTGLLEAFDWGVIDLGDIDQARYLEAMAMVTAVYWVKTQKWTHAFKLVGK